MSFLPLLDDEEPSFTMEAGALLRDGLAAMKDSIAESSEAAAARLASMREHAGAVLEAAVQGTPRTKECAAPVAQLAGWLRAPEQEARRRFLNFVEENRIELMLLSAMLLIAYTIIRELASPSAELPSDEGTIPASVSTCPSKEAERAKSSSTTTTEDDDSLSSASAPTDEPDVDIHASHWPVGLPLPLASLAVEDTLTAPPADTPGPPPG